MGTKPLGQEMAQEALDAFTKAENNEQAAADALGLARPTFQNRLKAARRMKLSPSAGIEDLNNLAHVRHRLQRAEKDLAALQKEKLDEAYIKRHIVRLEREVSDLAPPTWLVQARPGTEQHGVPTLFLSDLHWGEKVEPSQ